jgi:hypothetical protein
VLGISGSCGQQNFVSSTTAAQAIYEFIIGDVISTDFSSAEASEGARYALNCQNTDIIMDMRKLNARPKSNIFDKFCAKMAEIVEERVCDRRHGELVPALLPVLLILLLLQPLLLVMLPMLLMLLLLLLTLLLLLLWLLLLLLLLLMLMLYIVFIAFTLGH